MTESMSQRRAGHGFTLIELLIVVAIVAILTVTAIASYEFAMVKARTSAANAVAASTNQAVRSSVVRISLLPTLRNQAATSARISSQK